jgi:hypothetical protein
MGTRKWGDLFQRESKMGYDAKAAFFDAATNIAGDPERIDQDQEDFDSVFLNDARVDETEKKLWNTWYYSTAHTLPHDTFEDILNAYAESRRWGSVRLNPKKKGGRKTRRRRSRSRKSHARRRR